MGVRAAHSESRSMTEQERKAAKHLSQFKPVIVLGLLLTGFLIIETLVPLRTAVQIGADEGFELAKATLCLNGHRLYTEVWNDQPPLHTFLVTELVRHVSASAQPRS